MMSTMSNGTRNYFKLDLLIGHSHPIVRQLFKYRYSLFSGGNVWDDLSYCGKTYLTNVIATNKHINLTAVQKTSICNGDSNKWDLTLFTALLLNTTPPKTLTTIEIQQLDKENTLLKKLRNIRNQLAHNPTKSIDDIKFNQLWVQLVAILVAFGAVDAELDKLKDDSVFESPAQVVNEENMKEAARLNSLGTEAHQAKQFFEAITLFTKAIVIPSVSDHDRAVFYSNLSSSRLALYEQRTNQANNIELQDTNDERYHALQDAKEARRLWLLWWKGHFCVGRIYAALNECKKAINSFERALALAPSNNEILEALDDVRDTHSRQLRQDHLNPLLQPRTMFERLNEIQQKLGIDPHQVRLAFSSLETLDQATADLVKGLQYEMGDIDVKQDYEQAAKYYAKAASHGNAGGMYNLARLTDNGLGVKKDHILAHELFEQAAAQPLEHPNFKGLPNEGVADAEHALGLRYTDGIVVHKNLATAAYWYGRAIEHGSAESANNLGLMYLSGMGVDKDLDKAEKLFNLSARRGASNAMFSLAELLLLKGDTEMAKIWYDRACESGDIIAQKQRPSFQKRLQKMKQSMDLCPSNILPKISAIKKTFDSLKMQKTIYKLSDQPYPYDYNMLCKYAERGSVTAQRLCNALQHFGVVLGIVCEFETLTKEQEDTVVSELSECYRIEHYVASILVVEMRQKIEKIIDRVLHRCSMQPDTSTSQLDEDARTCYAVLHMDSFKLVDRFLDECKQKYPKSVYFYELAAAVNEYLARYDVTLLNANTGLELDPNNIILLYDKAVALRQLNNNMKEAIEAHKTFLKSAPKDHRKVPEAYYCMASCYFLLGPRNVLDIVKKVYKQGEQAEKNQLPCFLPYKCNHKSLIKLLLGPTFKEDAAAAAPTINRKSRLNDPRRIEVIKKHREWEAYVLQMKSSPTQKPMFLTKKPRVTQKSTKSLIGLKPISLREMNPTKDHVYDGYALSVTIIDEAYSWTPSIHLVIEDEHFDCEQLFIYGFPESHGDHLIKEVFTIGSKMHIINPYLRIGFNDMQPFIRVDDFSSIVMQNESERVLKMCRCCGEPNSLHVCARCRKTFYCTKECQIIDWKLYNHKLICRNNENTNK